MVVGSYLFVLSGSVPVVAVGSTLAIAAAVMITWMFWTCGRAPG